MKKKKQRIYILPTGFGLVFIGGAVVMILIGAAYQNNLVNMLAFFMLSLIFVSMIQTHNNLKDVSVEALETEGGFQGREFLVTTVLGNGAKGIRFNLEAALKKIPPRSSYENNLPLPPKGSLKLRASYPAQRRGLHTIQRTKVSSVYPLGLFRAWCWYETRGEYHIYPELKGDRPLPTIGKTDQGGHTTQTVGGDDFHGHRKFQHGDSQRHIDWKAYARGRPLLVKEFNEGPPGSAVLDWHALEGMDPEAKLSQLASWVDDAKNKKVTFSLRLPGKEISPGQGLNHAITCWEALAEFDPSSPTKTKSKGARA